MTGSLNLPVVVHIDDDQDLIDLTRIALQSLDVRFLGVVRSMAGLETVRFVKPAMVLLDLMMPEMDGWHLLEKIKSDAELRNTHVVIYSALSSDSQLARGRVSIADGYLTKPCTPARLREMVMRMTGAVSVARRPVAQPPATTTPGATPEAPRNLPATEMAGMPGAVVEFIDRYLDNTLSLEIVTYLRDMTEHQPSAGELAQALGRKPAEIEAPLNALIDRGVVEGLVDDNFMRYRLKKIGPVRAALDGFFEGCKDPQVRVKAIYRIIRRKSQWR